MEKAKVVIVGGGFGGIEAARGLAGSYVDITLLDRTNYHLFQPLLYQVATAALSPSDILYPIRSMLQKQKNCTVFMAEITDIDVEGKAVIDSSGKRYPYEFLVLACGARHSYFGNDALEKVAPGLKTIPDALEIRRRYLTAFEEAEKAETDAERDAWMTFVIVGGGPTGCELAGVLPEIAKRAMHPDFRRIDTNRTRVILVENSVRPLNAFPGDLAEVAMRDLTRLGVEFRFEVKATQIDENGVTLSDGEHIPAKTVLWAAGNQAAPIGAALGVERDRAGRIPVNPDLSVQGHPEIFVVGDMAAASWGEKGFVPGVAQGAMQGGAHAARMIRKRLSGEDGEPFVYKDLGNLAVLGRGHAVADVNGKHFSGLFAWLFWLFIHILKLVGFRNRATVLVQWAFNYLTFQRGARLISGVKKEQG
ncbi:MAG: NAD(P)/FAD-dependent oxidoreductase [Armatimonas sp.]